MSMTNEVKKDLPDEQDDETKGKISGFTQFVVGELETIGGVLTGDPLTQAEGEFNVEVGTVREDIEEDLEEGERSNEDERNS
jgi:uncharacterized protein YjbJ (UPF0337 family)